MKLVFLYGLPGAGKLTIGRELAGITGMALFHNHLVVDAVGAVFPFGTEAFVRLRERFWLDVFSEAVAVDRSLIFTFAPEQTVAENFPFRVRDLVSAAGGATHFVRLDVSDVELERRIDAPNRAAFGKLQSVELLRELRPAFASAMRAMPQPLVSIDTERCSPRAAAEAIAAALPDSVDARGADGTRD
jgi:hypothetical protein